MERTADEKHPRVGIGVMIMNETGEVLLGLRKASHGKGEWSFPGGHLEFGETIFETASREVLEETGLSITDFALISVCDEMRYLQSDGKHYVNIGLKGAYTGGEPRAMEPHKCSEWKWFLLDQLPEKLFESTELMIRNFRNGTLYQPG